MGSGVIRRPAISIRRRAMFCQDRWTQLGTRFYHYAPKEHGLELREFSGESVARLLAPFLLGFSSDSRRFVARSQYGERYSATATATLGMRSGPHESQPLRLVGTWRCWME